MLNKRIITSEGLRKDLVNRLEVEYAAKPEFIKRREAKRMNIKQEVVEVVADKKNFKGKLAAALTAVVATASAYVVIDTAVIDYTLVNAVINWYADGANEYASVYDAIKQMNPDISSHSMTKLIHEFKSINGLHSHYDLSTIQAGSYKIPVMK